MGNKIIFCVNEFYIQENCQSLQDYQYVKPIKKVTVINKNDFSKLQHYMVSSIKDLNHQSPILVEKSFIQEESLSNRYSSNQFEKSFLNEKLQKLYKKSTLDQFQIQQMIDQKNSILNSQSEMLQEIILHQFKQCYDNLDLIIKHKSLSLQNVNSISSQLKKQTYKSINIELESIKLTDEYIRILTDGLQTQKKLTKLSLKFQNSDIENKSLKYFCNIYQILVYLIELKLDFSYNQKVNGFGLEDLNLYLLNIKGLQKFQLNLNKVQLHQSDLFILELTHNLTMFQLLELNLQFSQTKIQQNIITSLFSKIKYCHKLTKLKIDLSQNKITSEQIKILTDSIYHLESLKQLKLSLVSCGLSLKDYQYILIKSSKLNYLQSLNIKFSQNQNDNNQQSDQMYLIDYINPEYSFASIKKFKIDLSQCKLRHQNIENIQFIFLCMKNLENLSMQLMDCTMQELEQSAISINAILSMKKLKKINIILSEKNFIGFEQICLLSELEYIDLSIKNQQLNLSDFSNNLAKLSQIRSLNIEANIKQIDEDAIRNLFLINMNINFIYSNNQAYFNSLRLQRLIEIINNHINQRFKSLLYLQKLQNHHLQFSKTNLTQQIYSDILKYLVS